MSMIAASKSTRPQRWANTSSVGTCVVVVLGPTATFQRQQAVRAYRLGRLWTSYLERTPYLDRTSYLDPSSHRDAYKRHHGFRYEFQEAFVKKQKDKVLSYDTKTALKRMVKSWDYSTNKGGGAEGRTGTSYRTPENTEGVRPGQNIEDAERAPLEHLLFGKSSSQPSPARSPSSQATASPRGIVDTSDAEYIIDPITNRKVPRAPRVAQAGTATAPGSNIDNLNTSFKSYRSQFSHFLPPNAQQRKDPIFHDGPPPEAELKLYSQTQLNPDPLDSTSKSATKDRATGQSSGPVACSGSSTNRDRAESAPDLLDALSGTPKNVKWMRSEGFVPGSNASAVNSWTIQPQKDKSGDLRKYQPLSASEQSDEPHAPPSSSTSNGLHKYGSAGYQESDRQVETQSPKYDDLDKYGAVRSHEPDGIYKDHEESTPAPVELKKYKAFRSQEPNGLYAPSPIDHPDAAELEKYSKPFLSHEPHGMYAPANVQPQLDEAELSKYQAYWSHEPDGIHEPDGRYANAVGGQPPKPVDSGDSGSFHSDGADGKSGGTPASSEKPDLGNHEAFGYEDSEAGSLLGAASAQRMTTGLNLDHGAQKSEPNGVMGLELQGEAYEPEEVSQYQAAQGNESNEKSDAKADVAVGKPQSFPETKPGKSEFRKTVEELMAKAATEPERKADEDPARVERPSTLTGNYVKDFPGEFSVAWTADGTKATSSLLPEDLELRTSNTEPGQVENGGTWAASSSSSSLQPALDRQNGISAVSPTTSSDDHSTADPPPAAAATPAVYKVLVYDPATQRVEVAETTSTALESSEPPSPAEVLLRISNPSKFFPHFAPLRSQGFEIASGSGDVLVFRKVREPDADAGVEEHKFSSSSNAETTTTPHSINPIDMTGGARDYSVATSWSASPTGFVNFDFPVPRDAPLHRYGSSPLGSETRARTEESEAPLYGQKSESKSRERKEGKKGVLLRVVTGGLWVGGIAYVLGVAGKYFDNAAGGSDKVKSSQRRG